LECEFPFWRADISFVVSLLDHVSTQISGELSPGPEVIYPISNALKFERSVAPAAPVCEKELAPSGRERSQLE